jgi:hypothetical protein
MIHTVFFTELEGPRPYRNLLFNQKKVHDNYSSIKGKLRDKKINKEKKGEGPD